MYSTIHTREQKLTKLQNTQSIGRNKTTQQKELNHRTKHPPFEHPLLKPSSIKLLYIIKQKEHNVPRVRNLLQKAAKASGFWGKTREVMTFLNRRLDAGFAGRSFLDESHLYLTFWLWRILDATSAPLLLVAYLDHGTKLNLLLLFLCPNENNLLLDIRTEGFWLLLLMFQQH